MVSNTFVVLLGMGTVFAGLIIIILLCKLMSFFIRATENKTVATPSPVTAPAENIQSNNEIPNKQSLIAAVSAVAAEETGTDITNIRIHSIKRT